jgi:transposase
MIFLSNRVRILVATKPIDFRKGHDGLSAMVSSVLRKDPFTGTVFVFRARRADRLNLLYWDGNGLVMAYKRLEASTFVLRNPSGHRQRSPAKPAPRPAALELQIVALSIG